MFTAPISSPFHKAFPRFTTPLELERLPTLDTLEPASLSRFPSQEKEDYGRMSDPKATATPEAAYYASGSYQQGANPVTSTSSDQEYALRLQSEEFRNAQQVCPAARRAWLHGIHWLGVRLLAYPEGFVCLRRTFASASLCALHALHASRDTVRNSVLPCVVCCVLSKQKSIDVCA